MSPRDAVNDFLSRHIIGLIVAVLSGGIAYGVLQVKVEAKADRVDVEAIAHEVRTIKYLLCKQTPDDSACRGVTP